MNTPSIPELRFRYKYLFVILALVIAGLFLLIVSFHIEVDSETLNGAFWKTLCEQLATALLVGGFTGGLYEYFLRGEFIKHTNDQTKKICEGISDLGKEAAQRGEGIRDFFAANTEQRELGVSHCFREVDRFDFSDDIENTKRLIAILNDGRGWTGNYYQRFVNRFSKPNTETKVILMHPNSDAIALHAHKVGATPEGIRMKIAETVRLLKRANQNSADLQILGHRFYNTMSVFLTEETAIMTPYFLSKVRRTPPVFTFIDSGIESFYKKLENDLEALLVDCEDISDYVQEDGSPLNA